MSEAILGYYANGKPIKKLKPGSVSTACVISCGTCGEIIRGNGGPSRGAMCPEHATRKITFEKSYPSENLNDMEQDTYEAFFPDFNPVMKTLPKNEQGFIKGSWKVTICWEAGE